MEAPGPKSDVEERGHAARWPWARIARTSGYSTIGLLGGIFLPPTFFMLGLIVVHLVGWMLAGSNASTTLTMFGIAALVTLALMYGTMYVATKGTCTRSPVAPLGVAIGAGVGSTTWVVVTLVQFDGSATESAILFTSAVLGVFLMATGALQGGKKGLVEALGNPQQGEGDLCARCGYDLIATPPHMPCPECGTLVRYRRSLKPAGEHEPGSASAKDDAQ